MAGPGLPFVGFCEPRGEIQLQSLPAPRLSGRPWKMERVPHLSLVHLYDPQMSRAPAVEHR